MGDRLAIVSAERIRDELDRLVVLADPSPGLWFLADTGLADHFLPELGAMRLEQDPIHHHKDVLAHTIAVVRKTAPDLVLRLAALFHDIGKPATRDFGPKGVTFHHHEVVGARMTRKRMKELKYPNDVRDDVSQLVFLHLRFHGYGDEAWTDAAVRRYVRDAGPLLEKLNDADPLRLHHPQPAQGRDAVPAHGRARGAHRRAPRAGGHRRHPPRPRRPAGDGRCSTCRPARWSARR